MFWKLYVKNRLTIVASCDSDETFTAKFNGELVQSTVSFVRYDRMRYNVLPLDFYSFCSLPLRRWNDGRRKTAASSGFDDGFGEFSSTVFGWSSRERENRCLLQETTGWIWTVWMSLHPTFNQEISVYIKIWTTANFVVQSASTESWVDKPIAYVVLM